MCGIAGLFVGCSAVSYRPTRRPAAGRESDAPREATGVLLEHSDREYRSAFKRWDEKSAVRSAPRRELSPDDDGKLLFTPGLVPAAHHPLVGRLSPALFEQVLAQHLYRYLDFTTKLEQIVVNRTALGIAHASVDLGVPEEMRFDAYRLYCDEAYHALFSQDLLRQAVARSGIVPRLPRLPYFLVRLQQIMEGLEPERRPLAELLFVIVSETLISGSLSDVPTDPRVAAGVHEVVHDHALDEGRHHAYFAAFLKVLWGALAPAERIAGAAMVPDLVHAFLQPDRPAVLEELCGYGLSRDEAQQVLAEVWPDEIVMAAARASAARTISYFRVLGALDEPEVAERFTRAGLVAG